MNDCKSKCDEETVQGEVDPAIVKKCLFDSADHPEPELSINSCISCLNGNMNS